MAASNPAIHDYPLQELIRRRWSPRAFEDKPVEDWKLCALLEAARWAPSCYNEQPWRFVIGNKALSEAAHQQMLSFLVDANVIWAKKAPVLMLSVAKRHFTHNGQENRHHWHDVGLAMENLVLQAEALELSVHQMAGFVPQRAVDALGIPPEYEPVAMAAIGYAAPAETLPNDELIEREEAPRGRKPLQEICFSHHWGQTYPACFN